MVTVSFLQPIILKVGWVQQGQGHSLGGYGWKGNSLFSFAIRYFHLAHEAACEAGPSVYFSLILQDIKGFCKLSVTRRPTFLIPNSTKKCRSHLAVKTRQKTRDRGRGGLFLLFFSPSVIWQVILLITFSILLSPFCSSAFYLREFHFCRAIPCGSCFWFVEAQVDAFSHV